MPEALCNIDRPQFLAENEALRKRVEDLQFLVVELLVKNELLRSRLMRRGAPPTQTETSPLGCETRPRKGSS
jgi:hypothetical protein